MPRLPRLPPFVATIASIIVAGCFASAPRPAIPPPSEKDDEVADEVDYDLVHELEELAARDAYAGVKEQHVAAGVAAVVDNTKTKNMCRRGRCPSGYRCGSAPGRPRKVCYAAGARRNGPSTTFEVTAP
jgi:hypothetical protein